MKYYYYYYFIAIIKILLVELYYMFVVLTVWSGRLIFFLLFSVDNPVKSSLTDRHVENITI